MAHSITDVFRDVLRLVPVVSVGQNNPPVSVAGERYVVGTAGAGAWAGLDNHIVEGDGVGWIDGGLPLLNWAALDVLRGYVWGWTGAAWEEVYAFGSNLVISPAAIAAQLNDGSPVDATNSFNVWQDAAATRFTLTGDQSCSGLVAAADVTRALKIILNVDTVDTLTLLHQDAGSAAANQFTLPDGAALAIPPGGGVFLLYDFTSSMWRVLSLGAGGAGSMDSFQADAVDAVFQSVDIGAGALPNATPNVRGTHAVLDFSQAIDAGNPWQLHIPIGYQGGTLRVNIYWVGHPENAGDCLWAAAFERNNVAHNVDADDFAAAQTVASPAPASAGDIQLASIDFTQAQADGVVAGDPFRLFVGRLGADGDDTLAGTAQLLRVVVEEI
jgi:hypothetical protein